MKILAPDIKYSISSTVVGEMEFSELSNMDGGVLYLLQDLQRQYGLNGAGVF